MATQVVHVTGVERKSGSNNKGGWFFDIVETAGGTKFQTKFNESFLPDPGANVAITYHEEARGNFTNNVIDSYEVQGSASVNATTGAASADDRQTRIERQSTLKMAIQAAELLGLNDVSVSDLYDMADEFQRYVREGQTEYAGSERL